MTTRRKWWNGFFDWFRVGRLISSAKVEIMASIAQLQDKVAELQATVDLEQEQVAAAIAKLEDAVAVLQAIVDEGGTVEERQAVLDGIEAARVDLEGTVVPDAPPEDEFPQ